MQRHLIFLIGLGFIVSSRPALTQNKGLEIEGWLNFGGIQTTGPSSWLTGDFGKLTHGNREDGEGFGRANLAVAFQPSTYFRAYMHLIGRWQPDDSLGEDWGIPEAYLETQLGKSKHTLQLKLGWFFPPTSMENTDPLWSSPYTVTLSSINSWLAEEVRTTGVDLRYSYEISEKTFYAEASLLAGNDSLGALLAWRGWTLGQRISVWNEALPLPPLESLTAQGVFAPQNPKGTKPLVGDKDGRLGFATRLGLEWAKGLLLLNYLDNQGDRLLYQGEYSWETRFHQMGFSLYPLPQLTILGEYLSGETGMGPESSPHVQVDFQAWYLLPSLELGPIRISVRYDDFETVDLDRLRVPINAEFNQENGHAWTAALFYQPTQSWRFGLEWVNLDAVRKRDTPAPPSKPHSDASSWTLEARFRF